MSICWSRFVTSVALEVSLSSKIIIDAAEVVSVVCVTDIGNLRNVEVSRRVPLVLVLRLYR